MTVSRRTKKELARFFRNYLGVQFEACFSVVLFSEQIGGLQVVVEDSEGACWGRFIGTKKDGSCVMSYLQMFMRSMRGK